MNMLVLQLKDGIVNGLNVEEKNPKYCLGSYKNENVKMVNLQTQ